MDHLPHDQSPQPPNPFDHALFLNTQNALWGCTLSAMFTREKRKEEKESEGERRLQGGLCRLISSYLQLILKPRYPMYLHLHHCSHSQKIKKKKKKIEDIQDFHD